MRQAYDYWQDQPGTHRWFGWLHTYTHTRCVYAQSMLFHLVCVVALGLGSWFGSSGGGGPAVAGTAPPPPPQQTSKPAQPATHTNVFAFVCCFTYILYMLHITQTDRHRSISLSLSIHSLGSCCLHTLTPPPPHDSRRACVCVCVYVHLAPFRAMLQTSR